MFDLSIIIVNWNTRDLLYQCLSSIGDAVGDLAIQLVVVDNASTDGSVEMVRQEFAEAELVVNTENVGFVRANNQALAQCRGRHVLLLNSDTKVLRGALERSVAWLDTHPRAGIVGVRLLNPDGSFQASYTPFPTLWREFLILSGLGRLFVRPVFPSRGPEMDRGPQKIDGYLEGAFLMVRREAIDHIGDLDENIFMYAEDVDWCYRFWRAGWEIWYLPSSLIVHHGGQSSRKRQGRMEAEMYRSRIYFFQKHYGKVAAFCLRSLVWELTVVKWCVHGSLRLVSGGRWGRTVAEWHEVREALRADLVK